MLAFNHFETLIQMGGYSVFVWPAFAIGLGLLFANYLFVRSHFRRSKKSVKKDTERMVSENRA